MTTGKTENKGGRVLSWRKGMNDKGEGTVVFATFDVIDKDGDVTLPGAFGTQTASIVPAHNWGHVPIGKAYIYEQGNEALADIKLNLEIPSARDWYHQLKHDMENGTPVQEWSYGYEVIEHEMGTHGGQNVRILKKLKVYELSPVIVGAGVNTRTTDIKEKKAEYKWALDIHSTETNPGIWDGLSNERRVKVDGDDDYYKGFYAWAESVKCGKNTWGFIHHFSTQDGEPGAASTRACIVGIAILNGAKGRNTLSRPERVRVYNHLAKHLKDAGIETPELREYDTCSVKFSDQILHLTWDAETLLERCKTIKALRIEDGRDLASARYEELGALGESIKQLQILMGELDGLLSKKAPASEAELALARNAYTLSQIDRILRQ